MQLLKTFLALIILAMAVSATSCHTFKRAAQTFDTHPKEAAEYCGVKFPVKPFTKTTTKYLPGKRDTVTKHDTVTAKCPDGTVIKTPCPPSRTITVTDTLVIHDTTTVENTAIAEGLHYELIDSKAAEQKASDKAAFRLKWAWGATGLCLLLIAFLGLLFTGKIR